MHAFCVLSVALFVYLSGLFTRDILHLPVGEGVGLALDLNLLGLKLRYLKNLKSAIKQWLNYEF